MLAAGFCERWPKACAMGLRWLRPAAFDYGKNLPLMYPEFMQADTLNLINKRKLQHKFLIK